MLYTTKSGKTFKSDRGMYLYIDTQGRYVVRLAKFGHEISLINREAFDAWLMGNKCYIFKEVA